MLELQFSGKLIKTTRPAFVMGIVNVTPDSFFSGSRGGAERAFKLIDEGADILDIGGESTRPGYTPVSCEEEINRIIPVIKEIRKKSDVIISVDTTKYEVMKAALEEGADIFNDVTALENDERKIELAAKNNLSVVLMHQFYGDEASRITSPTVTSDVIEYLENRADIAVKNGIKKENIIFDPGIGFGKTFEENVALINEFSQRVSEYPVLMALSRKRCIGTMIENPDADRLTGTVMANVISVQKGSKIVRVHDVKETVQALNMMKYLK